MPIRLLSDYERKLTRTINDIEVFALSTEKLNSKFNSEKFIKAVYNTRLTTHMTLEDAFEYEKNNL